MLLVHNILLSFTIGLIVTRYDKSDAHDFGLSIRDFVPNNQDLGINSNIESKVGNPFEIRFECGQGIAVELCEYAHDAIRSGLNRISLEIMITKTIIVNAKYHSFCASESGNPNCREVLGRAQPSAYFPVNTAEGQVHLYPQSLIKQLIVDQPLLLSESDIYAEYVEFK